MTITKPKIDRWAESRIEASTSGAASDSSERAVIRRRAETESDLPSALAADRALTAEGRLYNGIIDRISGNAKPIDYVRIDLFLTDLFYAVKADIGGSEQKLLEDVKATNGYFNISTNMKITDATVGGIIKEARTGLKKIPESGWTS